MVSQLILLSSNCQRCSTLCLALLGLKFIPAMQRAGGLLHDNADRSATSKPDTRSYIPPVPIDGIMRGAVIARVTASKSSKYDVGDLLYASCGWREESIVDASDTEVQKLDIAAGAKVTDALGVLGMTGLTAYFGILDVGKVRAGDFVVVSGAAGATGSVVCQIAKLKGAKVLGLAGSDEKVQWLKELGCDDALNYKDAKFPTNFRTSTKVFIRSCSCRNFGRVV